MFCLSSNWVLETETSLINKLLTDSNSENLLLNGLHRRHIEIHASCQQSWRMRKTYDLDEPRSQFFHKIYRTDN